MSAATAGDVRFQGMWKDPTGLYYVRARTYEAETGRFTSRDPVEGQVAAPESFQPYAFVTGNPFLYEDPTGELSTGLRELNVVEVGVLVLAATAIARPHVVTTAGQRRQEEPYRVVIQAQGEVIGGKKRDQIKSYAINQPFPVTVSQGLEALQIVRAQLPSGVGRTFDESGAFEEAADWIRSLPPAGQGPPGESGFTGKGRYRGRPDRNPGRYLRVDVPIFAGTNFVSQ